LTTGKDLGIGSAPTFILQKIGGYVKGGKGSVFSSWPVKIPLHHKRTSIQASSRATLASGLAILLLPLTLGRLAGAEGIRLAYGVVFLLIGGTFLIFQLAARRNQGSGVRDQGSEKI
jgi:hypothetical protein